jgi:hypothetical protein
MNFLAALKWANNKPGIGYQAYYSIHPHVFQILGRQEHTNEGSKSLACHAGQ